MVIALLALQVIGFAVLYVVLKRVLMRHMRARDVVPDARAEVDALIAELNGTTERNVALLEDGIRRLHELLARMDGAARTPPAVPESHLEQPGSTSESATERRAEVLHLRRMGMSSAAIVDRLATSPGEVELIVNLADSSATRRSS